MKYLVKVLYYFDANDDADARPKAKRIVEQSARRVTIGDPHDPDAEQCDPVVKYQKLPPGQPPKPVNL